MKKLNLTAFDKGEILTRAQLKKVIGGYDAATCAADCNTCPEGWTKKPDVNYSVSIEGCVAPNTCSATDDDKVVCGNVTLKCSENLEMYCTKNPPL
jgi:hypothetical protein